MLWALITWDHTKQTPVVHHISNILHRRTISSPQNIIALGAERMSKTASSKKKGKPTCLNRVPKLDFAVPLLPPSPNALITPLALRARLPLLDCDPFRSGGDGGTRSGDSLNSPSMTAFSADVSRGHGMSLKTIPLSCRMQCCRISG